MKRICAVILIICLMLLPGCWSRKEPKSLAIVNSVLYDIKDGGGFVVTLEIMNPAAQGGIRESGNGKSPNITVISEGASVPEAIRDSSDSLENVIFGGHNKARFFSENFAKQDMAPIMDYLLRDHLTDENPLIIVVKNENPGMIYSSGLGLSDTVGDYIEGLSKSQPKVISKSVYVNTLDFIKDHYEDGKQPVAGVVELLECDSKPAKKSESSKGSDSAQQKLKIVYEGLAAFKDGKLAGYMDGVETRAYNFITNNVDFAVVSVMSGGDTTALLISGSRADIKANVIDNRITADIKIKVAMSVIQETGKIDVSKNEALKAVEESFNKQMQEEIKSSIKKAQTEFKSDIFGFGKALHAQHPKRWREVRENWDEYFATLQVNVEVQSSVGREGEIKQPFSVEG